MRVEKFILSILLAFNIMTLILYILSPFSTNTGFKFINVIFIAFNIFMIALGFSSGLMKSKYIELNTTLLVSSKNLFGYILIFYICTFTLRYSYMLFTPPFDIPALINRIMVGVLDPHAGRFFSHNGIRTMPWTIYFLISIIDSIFFIISIVKWKEHSNRIKFLIIILAIFELFFWRGTGTNFGSFMMITSILFTVIASSKVYFIEKKTGI